MTMIEIQREIESVRNKHVYRDDGMDTINNVKVNITGQLIT